MTTIRQIRRPLSGPTAPSAGSRGSLPGGASLWLWLAGAAATLKYLADTWPW